MSRNFLEYFTQKTIVLEVLGCQMFGNNSHSEKSICELHWKVNFKNLGLYYFGKYWLRNLKSPSVFDSIYYLNLSE